MKRDVSRCLAFVCEGVLALGLAACEHPPPEPAPTVSSTEATTSAPALSLSIEARQLYRRALVRDPNPSCTELTAGLTQPVTALLEVTERVTMPPTAPMRAATCLAREHAADPRVEPVLTRWVRERATMGFGLLVLHQLDALHQHDPARAERLARAALSGEYPEQARARIARSSTYAPLLEAPAQHPARQP